MSVSLCYTALSPFCRKVRMAMEHKGLAFALVQVDNPKKLPAWNPRVEVPVLIDGETFVCNSSDILGYLDRRFPITRSIRLCRRAPMTTDRRRFGAGLLTTELRKGTGRGESFREGFILLILTTISIRAEPMNPNIESLSPTDIENAFVDAFVLPVMRDRAKFELSSPKKDAGFFRGCRPDHWTRLRYSSRK